MRVIPPLAITDSIFTSSTCAEPSAGEVAYNAGTTYALGDQVIVASDHRAYESLQAGNVGHTPISSPTWWVDVGPTNKWKMVDLLRNTQTAQASPLTVSFTPGVRIDSVALLGLDAESVTVSMTSSGTTVYANTINLNTRVAVDWYDYFFLPFYNKPSIVLFDLPPYTNGVLTISITRASGNCKCGGVVIGSQQYLGEAEYGAIADTLNFSTVDRDTFGNSVLIQRRSIPKTNQTVIADKSILNQIRAARDALNAVPALWSSVEDVTSDFFESGVILGYYRNFSIALQDVSTIISTIELEEV